MALNRGRRHLYPKVLVTLALKFFLLLPPQNDLSLELGLKSLAEISSWSGAGLEAFLNSPRKHVCVVPALRAICCVGAWCVV